MANAYSANVVFVDTDATALPYAKRICGIKYIGNASGTLTIKSNGATGGKVIWEESGATNVYNQVEIVDTLGVFVNLTNGAKVYLYLA